MQLIGEGMSAHVVQESPTTVLKVFKRHIPNAFIDREFTVARFAFRNGVPTPEPLALLTQDTLPAIRYEYDGGTPLSTILMNATTIDEDQIRSFAKLHFSIHSINAADLVHLGQRELFARFIKTSRTTNSMKRRAIEALEDLSAITEVSLCHGDFVSGNVLVQGQNATVIDWMVGSAGDPAADFATFWLSAEMIPLAGFDPVLEQKALSATSSYRKSYLDLAGDDFGIRADAWMFPTAVARLGAQQMLV